MKSLWQSCPVTRFHQERDVRLSNRVFEFDERIDRNPVQVWFAQHKIEIAAIMAASVHAAAVGPDFDIGQMFLQQRTMELASDRIYEFRPVHYC